MILLEMKRYIEARGEVPLTHLAHAFNLDTNTAEMMMSQWVKRGTIEKLENQPCPSLNTQSLCGGCSGNCHTSSLIHQSIGTRQVIYRMKIS
ncbi:hypothetical protein B9T19_06855 [Ignatzschineria sp. F8392]|uniref:FeoC-like transcriptional regulator n=1 Tax=Ignatzschineria sp. F8392 TaxID=1980117 RepID=UPI000B98B533|nr:FeoC-like transcriptional regulator [Ignatzschineria sp. F8392]OYQ79483.1 hypothetical protein B9T19_06855 [Ignatzschineria sp. F8392]